MTVPLYILKKLIMLCFGLNSSKFSPSFYHKVVLEAMVISKKTSDLNGNNSYVNKKLKINKFMLIYNRFGFLSFLFTSELFLFKSEVFLLVTIAFKTTVTEQLN